MTKMRFSQEYNFPLIISQIEEIAIRSILFVLTVQSYASASGLYLIGKSKQLYVILNMIIYLLYPIRIADINNDDRRPTQFKC